MKLIIGTLGDSIELEAASFAELTDFFTSGKAVGLKKKLKELNISVPISIDVRDSKLQVASAPLSPVPQVLGTDCKICGSKATVILKVSENPQGANYGKKYSSCDKQLGGCGKFLSWEV